MAGKKMPFLICVKNDCVNLPLEIFCQNHVALKKSMAEEFAKSTADLSFSKTSGITKGDEL